MRISLNNVWLTNDGATDLQSWTDAHDVLLNGRQVVQDAQFLRAVAAQPLARGNAVNHAAIHGDAAACRAWRRRRRYVLTAFSSLPASGTATMICGASGRDSADVHVFRGAGGDAEVRVSRDADGHDVCAAGRADHDGRAAGGERRWTALRS